MKEFIVTDGVHIRDKNTTTKMVKHLLIALLPIIIFVFIKNGIYPSIKGYNNGLEMLYPLIFLATGVITAIGLELIYCKFIQKQKVNYLPAALPGLLLALLLPLKTSLLMLMLGVIVGVIANKIIIKLLNKKIFNPALVGYLFLVILFPTIFASANYLNNYEIENNDLETPLNNLIALDFVGSYNEVVGSYGNLWDLFVGFKMGLGAEISVLLCLLAFIYLIYFKAIKIRIPLIYVGTVFIMTAFIGYTHNMDFWYPLFSIMTGGVFFTTIFLMADTETSPVTNIGQVIYALLLGILTIVFRYVFPLAGGIIIAILIMNGLVIYIDRFSARLRFNYYKALLILLMPILLMAMVSVYVSSTLISSDSSITDEDFKIITKTSDNNFVYYIVTEKCNNLVKAKVTLNKKGEVTQILLLENTEAYYNELLKQNYLGKIIENQSDLSKLKDIEGATRTTKGLKQMVSNVLIDYKNNGL